MCVPLCVPAWILSLAHAIPLGKVDCATPTSSAKCLPPAKWSIGSISTGITSEGEGARDMLKSSSFLGESTLLLYQYESPGFRMSAVNDFKFARGVELV